MKYLVRNDLSYFGITISDDFKTSLAALIQKHCLADVEVVYIDYDEQITVLETAMKLYGNRVIVSFDKLFIPEIPFSFGFNISRVFDKNIQSQPMGFIHDDFDVLNRRIKETLDYTRTTSIICYDDDTSSGNTLRYIESKIPYKIEWIFGHSFFSYGEVYDIIDLRDFFLENNLSGLYIQEHPSIISRKSYVSDCVNIEARAKLRNSFKKEFLELKAMYGY